MTSMLQSPQALAALEERGFAVEAQTDTTPAAVAPEVISLMGRRDDGAPRTVWIDAAGMVRYQRVRLVSEGPTALVTRGGRSYRVTQETQQIVNAWGRAETAQDVAAVLDALDELTGSVTEKGT